MKIKKWSLKKVKVIFNPERKSVYRQDDKDEENFNISDIQTKISSPKYFMESLD